MKINNTEYTQERLQEIANSCFDRTSFAQKLGFNYFNGKVSKKIIQIAEENNISIDHFDPTKKTKERRKYPIVEKECPVCGKIFETEIGSKEERTTCSYTCSNIYFAELRHTDSSNKKRSETLKNKNIEPVLYEKECLFCTCLFYVRSSNIKQKCCSQSCARKYTWIQPEYRANFQEKVENGEHKGWAKRSNLTPSFPEQYIMGLLDELNIKYTREYKVGRWFVDLADIDRKLALEVDGAQHNLPERKQSDEQKDKFLIENGWKVLRIKWKKVSKEDREEWIKSLQDFFQ